MTPRLVPAGDAGYYVRFGDAIDPELNEAVLAACARLEEGRPAGVLDVVPGYAALLVIVDPARADPPAVERWIEQTVAASAAAAPRPARRVEIPVLYDPAVAEDLESVARDKGLSPPALAALHSAPEYRCYLLGFRPGFPFLGGLDPRLATARLATPRVRVPAGSVAIGGRQTGVYPVASPGGWRIIGRTPLRLFDPSRPDPFLVLPGDLVRFVPIGAGEFARWGGDKLLPPDGTA